MGLHQGNNVDAQTSFFVAQLRKWLFASAFSRDKVVASFLGRPPRLSYRYCKLEVPLDLTDEELCDDGADLDTSLARLDANGWNTNGELGRRTWTRVWFQECVVREEILELALGSGDENIEQRAEEIRLKLERLRASFPDCMKVEPDAALSLDINACGGAYGVKKERVVRQFNAVYIIFIVAGTILTDFLLQRALVNRSKRDTQSLIPISRKMLKTVLVALSWKELFRDFQGDMIYLVSAPLEDAFQRTPPRTDHPKSWPSMASRAQGYSRSSCSSRSRPANTRPTSCPDRRRNRTSASSSRPWGTSRRERRTSTSATKVAERSSESSIRSSRPACPRRRAIPWTRPSGTFHCSSRRATMPISFSGSTLPSGTRV